MTVEDNKDKLTWNPVAQVSKYSQDQVDYASRLLGHNPIGAELESLFADPENGIVEVKGNLLTTTGLGNITNLLIAGGGQGLTSTRTIIGVGSTNTAAAVGNTALGADGTTGNGTVGAWYRLADSAPTRQTVTVTNDTIQVIGTFNTSNSDFAWQEWCLATCTGTVTAGTTLASTATGTSLVNRKVASMGTKAGGTWVLTVNVTLA